MALIIAVLGATLNPGGIITWLIVGLVAGFVASRVMRGGSYGIVGDVIVGLIGAFIGGLLASLLIPNARFGFWGSLIVSIIGACVFIAILHAFSSGTRRTL